MVVCPTCHREHAGPLKTCSACRDRIAAWKQKHQDKDRLYKRKYAARKRGPGGYDELFYSTRKQQDKWDQWVGLAPDEVMLWTGLTSAELWVEVAQVGYEEHVRDRCLGVLNGILAGVRSDHLQAMKDKGKQTECLILLKKIQLHLINVLGENGIIWQEVKQLPSKVSWKRDSDARMLARYEHLYNKALKVRASQLKKIQRTETREVCISVLQKAVAICDSTLKEMGFKE